MGSSPPSLVAQGWCAAPRVDLWARLSRPGAAEILWRSGPPHQDCILVAHAELGWRFRSRGSGAIVLDDTPVIASAPAAPPVQADGAATDSHAGVAGKGRAEDSGVAPTPPARDPGRAPAARAQGGSGSALFLGDLAGAFLLANEARYRTLERAFGIRREDANLATAIGLLTLANSVYERAHRPEAPRPPTAVANLAIGVGALRESIYGVAGPATRDTPLAGTLIALAVLGGLVRQPAARGLRGAKASSKRLKNTFRGRYGHLVNVGRGN